MRDVEGCFVSLRINGGWPLVVGGFPPGDVPRLGARRGTGVQPFGSVGKWKAKSRRLEGKYSHRLSHDVSRRIRPEILG